VAAPQLGGEPDPFVDVARRHPDVGDEHVRAQVLDRSRHGAGVVARRDDLDLRRAREHLLDALAHDDAVIAEDDSDCHEAEHIRAPRPCRTALSTASVALTSGPRATPRIGGL
jgi:hypothetical protein